MSRTVFISNRVSPPKDGEAAAGGLATAIYSALDGNEALWFGWSGRIADTPNRRVATRVDGNTTIATVDLTKSEYADYYNGYANRTLWPMFHYRVDLAQFERRYEERYREVNALFGKLAARLIEPDDLVWIHDYHMIPCGECLRSEGIDNRIGFFLHTPWPAREILVAMPRHERLVRALFAYDLIGFQTEGDRMAFCDYVVNEAGGTVARDGTASCFGRTVATGSFPIGIDADEFASLPGRAPARRHESRLLESARGRQLVFGVDRLDYSKGIANRFLAYEKLLEEHEAFRNAVLFLQIAPTSRGEVYEYRQMRTELESLAGHINSRFSDYDWVPLRYVNRSYSRTALAGLYRAADVAFITPLRDGMNLVAKEFVAAQQPDNPGVLVLSRFAGAARELTDAVIANPYDRDDMADALRRALTMPPDERRERWQAMMRCVQTNGIGTWRRRFLDALRAGSAAQRADRRRPRAVGQDRAAG